MTSQLIAAATSIGGITPPTDSYSDGSATDALGGTAAFNVEKLISNVIGLLTIVGGIFFVLYFVLGGINWITAGGDQGKIQKARDQMIQGVIGLVVIALSFGLLGIISKFVGLNLLDPGTAIINIRANG